MAYTLKIFTPDDVSKTERADAERRFRSALDNALGSEELVLPVYEAYLRLFQSYGDSERPWPVTTEEQLLADQWEAAELAAIRAAFGTERYMGDAEFEISP